MIEGKDIVLGVTGSISVFKACDIVRELKRRKAKLTIIMTSSATQFVTPLTFGSLAQGDVITDLFASRSYWEMEHVSVADKADLFLIAPATANIIGKIASGIADDFLTTTVMATTAPVFLAPAMNDKMFQNPIFQANMQKLLSLGYHLIEPEKGPLACGREGLGRLAPVERILQRVEDFFAREKDFQSIKVMVTAGPTQEPLDPVRYITNPSSGKMGYELAKAFYERGASEVLLITGPTSLPTPLGVSCLRVRTAQEMNEEVLKVSDQYKVIVSAAAVSDYRPVEVAQEKIKKGPSEHLSLQLRKNPDILLALGQRKKEQILVGFSVETQDLIKNSMEKLKKKHLDLIVANNVKEEGAGFGLDTNRATLIDAKGGLDPLPLLSKRELAHKILDRIKTLLG